MNKENKIKALEYRYNLIMKRGLYNNKIGNKILRKIRKLEREE